MVDSFSLDRETFIDMENCFMTYVTQQTLPLSKYVHKVLGEYFENLDGHKVTNLYTMVLEEIEIALLKEVMKHVQNNQSNAAMILGISRGTLRKKLKQYVLG